MFVTFLHLSNIGSEKPISLVICFGSIQGYQLFFKKYTIKFCLPRCSNDSESTFFYFGSRFEEKAAAFSEEIQKNWRIFPN